MQPLRNQAIRLFSKPPTKRSSSSKAEIAALASRFVEPLTRENPPAPKRPAPARPRVVARAERFTGQPGGTSTPTQPLAPARPMARGKTRLPINALISALVVVALVPLAILFVQLWQGMMRPHSRPLAEAELRIAETPPPADLAYPKKDEARLEADAGDGEETALPPAVATTDPVPYGAGGWNLAADETGALPLWVPPANSASDVIPEPDTGHGPVLTQPETPLSTAPSPAATELANATESQSSAAITRAERPDAAPAVPLPRRKPTASARAEPVVRTVKVVTIKAPPPGRPHDGAYALGSPAEAPAAPAEWMETKAPVDIHAKAEQSSETVKVADKGVKLRVTARDKNWVQVNDPASAATGWIYNRFLQPTEPPAQ